jgi:CubicO group peptidase (beta-lactamase class C family)
MALAACVATESARGGEPDPQPNYAEAIPRLEQVVEGEIASGAVSGVSIALVDDQHILHAKGYGHSDKARRLAAKADTVYRAGSISKLFTALAVMQFVEEGRVDLDQPVQRYAPEFRMVVPFADVPAITLRQLMSHRSGLIRESPVGGYFDDTEPSLDRTVASIAPCVLVYPPGTRTKYSNIGVAIVGRVVANLAGKPFERLQEERLLGPIGMTSSSFRLTRELKPRLAKGYMRVADGRDGFHEIEAPQFELGTIPAGNLYTTAEDLARFLAFLFAQGRVRDKALLRPATLEQMFTPQLTQETNGFGLGFSIESFRGHKTVAHMGAVYGFTSSLIGVPQHKAGVVVLCNDDIAVGPVRKLAHTALALLLEAKVGEHSPTSAPTAKLAAEDLDPFVGHYESESFWARVERVGNSLQANVSGQRLTLRPTAARRFEASGRIAHEAAVVFDAAGSRRANSFTALGQKFRRMDPAAIPATPPDWQKFLGSYGPKFIPVIISIKHGHLYAMTENEFDYRLTPLNRMVFKMPPGLYTDEQLVFQPDARGQVHSVLLANMRLARTRR